MRTLLIVVMGLWLGQEAPWTPFSDPANTHHPERVSAVDIEHYEIRLKLDDTKSGELEGETVVTFVPGRRIESLDLDAEDMTIRSVTTDRGGVATHALRDGKLVIHFQDCLTTGERTHLTIAYSAKPRHGMFWVTPDEGYPDKPWTVWTQGETDYNHHWFPCYDFPNDRATWNLSVTYPAKYVSVSNGTLAKSEKRGEWTTDRWEQSFTASSYLVSLVVGDLEKVEETFEFEGRKVPVQYFVPRGLHTEEEIRHTFGRTVEMMRFFSEKTGVPYPYPKYAQTVVHDFIWGGMENISATTLQGYAVVPKRLWMDRDSDGLIAHELAHQWFGDYATCRDWSHLWLNEGFATYSEALWQEHVGGSDALAEDMAGGSGWYFGSLKEYNRPIVCSVYTFADDVFDAWAYPKGAWVLHMLRKTIGDKKWWKGIRLYLKRHGGKVVQTQDFAQAMEEASGEELDWFFDQWVHKLGHPEFEVSSTWDEKAKKVRLTVEQKQKVEMHECGPLQTAVPIFRTFVDVEVDLPGATVNQRFLIDEAKEEFEIPCASEPLAVEFDPDGWLLKSLTFKKSQKELQWLLSENDEAIGRSWAARQLVADDVKPEPESVAKLVQALGDKSASVVRAAAEALAKVKSPEARKGLLEAKVKDARARWAVYKALGAFLPNEDVEVALVKAADQEESPNCIAWIYQALGEKGSAAFEQLEKAAKRYEKDAVVLPGILSGLQATKDERALSVFARFARYGVHPWIRQRAVSCLGEVLEKQEAGKRDASGLDTLISLLADPSYRMRRLVVDKLGVLREERSVASLEKRAELEFDKRLVKDIQEAVRKITVKK